MSGRSRESPQSDPKAWFASLGFSHGDPFATAEADQERALLPDFFVDVDGYESIKNPKSIIVFAPRGGGKSALRVMLSAHAAPTDPSATRLAVEFTDFGALVSRYRTGQQLSVDDYVPQLLRAGVQALLDTLCRNPTVAVSPPIRFRLAQLLREYHPEFLSASTLYERLQSIEPTFAPPWSAFFESASNRHLLALIEHSPLNTNAIARFLGDLNDLPDVPLAATPLDRVSSFVHVAGAVGLNTVEFLIDRLDEHKETADNPEAQADILEPLLADLPLLEMPGVAFKVFLSREARDVLLKRSTIRRDRLTDQAVTVEWDQMRLKHLLDERLVAYSDGKVHDLSELCQETRVEIGRERMPYLLGEWIEIEMLQLAQGSPRRLLVAAQLLCQAHMKRVGLTGLIEKADWEAAKAELMRKMPPLLRVQQDSRTARVGDRAVELTSLEHKILLTLIEARGRCDRNALAEKAWSAKSGVSEVAIDQAISRLRDKLGDDASNPVYLVTERKAFRLANYEVAED